MSRGCAPAIALIALIMVAAVGAGGCGSFDAAPTTSDASAGDGGDGGGGTADGGGGGDGSAACVAPVCPAPAPLCKDYDFASATCPKEWTFGGNIGEPQVKNECLGGKLHISATGTLDVDAKTSLSSPSTPYNIRVSARVAIKAWDGGAVLKLTVGTQTAFVLGAKIGLDGNPVFSLCNGAGNCQTSSFTAPLGEERLFTFEAKRDAGTTASIECQSLGQLPAVTMPLGAMVTLLFGHGSASPAYDATLDDVHLSFF